MPDNMAQNKEGLVLLFALPSKNASQQSTLYWNFRSKQLLRIQSLHACKQKGGQRRKLFKTQLRAGKEWNKSYCWKIHPRRWESKVKENFLQQSSCTDLLLQQFCLFKTQAGLPCREAISYRLISPSHHPGPEFWNLHVQERCRRGSFGEQQK